MFGSLARVKELFANRFEPDGDRFIFLANMGAPGIRVTAAERDRFVSNFNRGILIGMWATAALTIASIIAIFAVGTTALGKPPDYVAYLVVAVCFVPFLGAFFWLWGAPGRALLDRLPITEGLSKAEAQQTALQRLTWRRLGLVAATGPLLLLPVGFNRNLLVGWNRLWLLLAISLLVLAAVQAVRKWRAMQAP